MKARLLWKALDLLKAWACAWEEWVPKAVIVILFLLLLMLQSRLWVGDGSLSEVWQLRRSMDEQRQEIARIEERNRALRAEVKDLKFGSAAIEERARSELGMIKNGETFFQIIEQPESSSLQPSPAPQPFHPSRRR